jgi:long-chain acyl-CoA synthetase
MHTLGVEIRQTFAIAETGLIASQSLEENDFKTAGRPTMNSEIRILKNGEMLVRSTAMFSGYYKDPVKTGQVLIDGWYYTGIPAQIDEKGQLILTDKAAAKTEGT